MRGELTCTDWTIRPSKAKNYEMLECSVGTWKHLGEDGLEIQINLFRIAPVKNHLTQVLVLKGDYAAIEELRDQLTAALLDSAMHIAIERSKRAEAIDLDSHRKLTRSPLKSA